MRRPSNGGGKSRKQDPPGEPGPSLVRFLGGSLPRRRTLATEDKGQEETVQERQPNKIREGHLDRKPGQKSRTFSAP